MNFLAILALGFFSTAFAGHREGTGGGGWGCLKDNLPKNPDPKEMYEKLELLDFQEIELGLYNDQTAYIEKVNVDAPGTWEEHYNAALAKIKKADELCSNNSKFLSGLETHIAKIKSLWNDDHSDLSEVSDPISRVAPGEDWCPKARRRWVQIIQVDQNEKAMRINQNALATLQAKSQVAYAGIKLHEEIYSYLRSDRYALDSREARAVVAYAFSPTGSVEKLARLLTAHPPATSEPTKPRSCGIDPKMTIENRYQDCNETKGKNWRLIQREVIGDEVKHEVLMDLETHYLWGNFISIDEEFTREEVEGRGKKSGLCEKASSHRYGLDSWELPSVQDYVDSVSRGLMSAINLFYGKLFWASDVTIVIEPDPQYNWEKYQAYSMRTKAPVEITADEKARVQCISKLFAE